MKKITLALVLILLLSACSADDSSSSGSGSGSVPVPDLSALEQYSLSEKDQYQIIVPGEYKSGTAAPGLPFQLNPIVSEDTQDKTSRGNISSFFSSKINDGDTSDSSEEKMPFFTPVALPLTEEIISFFGEMPSHADSLKAYCQTIFGDSLKSFDFTELSDKESNPIYIIDILLADAETSMNVSIAFTTRHSYYFINAGVWFDEKYDDYPHYVLYSAEHFVDRTAQPMSADSKISFTRDYTGNVPQWDYPILNILASIKEYSKEEFPEAGIPNLTEDDYEIQWNNPDMEAAVRELTNVTGRPVRKSDLDSYSKLELIGGNAGLPHYELSADDTSIQFKTDEYIRDLDDLRHFANTQELTIYMRELTDISGISGMEKLLTLSLYANRSLSDLSPLLSLLSLRDLSLLDEYPNITDISFLGAIPSLQDLSFKLLNVTDINILSTLPDLQKYTILVNKEYDASQLDHSKYRVAFVNGDDQNDPEGVARLRKQRETERAEREPTRYDLHLEKVYSAPLPENPLTAENGIYLISSLEDLIYMQGAVNTNAIFADGTFAARASYKLTSDIDFSGYSLPWTPIGSYADLDGALVNPLRSSFQGKFDGDNHTISNFKLSDIDGRSYSGLFGYVTDGEIINVNMQNVDVSGSGEGTGGLVGGCVIPGNRDYLVIRNCHVQGQVTAAADNKIGRNQGNVGGIAGRAILIEGSSFKGTVNGSPEGRSGGLVGYGYKIYTSFADANVRSQGIAAGISGRSHEIAFCYSTGAVESELSIAAGISVWSCGISSSYTASNIKGVTAAGIAYSSEADILHRDGDTPDYIRNNIVFSSSISSLLPDGDEIAVEKNTDNMSDNYYSESMDTDFDTSGSGKTIDLSAQSSDFFDSILNHHTEPDRDIWIFPDGLYPQLDPNAFKPTDDASTE